MNSKTNKNELENAIRDFISLGNPPASEVKAWIEKIRLFGERVPEIMIDILENGNPNHSTAALYGLRAFGYEAWSEDYWENEYYKIRKNPNDNWIIIKPKNVLKNPNDSTLNINS